VLPSPLDTALSGFLFSRLIPTLLRIDVDVYTLDKGEFQSIILGGIVGGADNDMQGHHTTELNLVVKRKLRYETKNHQPVNTIFGKPWFNALQCVYDCYNQTVDAGLLNAPPFKVTDIYHQRYDTNDKVATPSTNPTYAAIISKLSEYEALFNSMEPIQPSCALPTDTVKDSTTVGYRAVVPAAAPIKTRFRIPYL
jgi:hypothetical protein